MAIPLSVNQIRLNAIILLLLARSPRRSMSEAQIIELGERSTWLTRMERMRVPSRTDSRFANMIHNLVSHRDSRTNPIRLKLIEWDRDSSAFVATERGMDFLVKVAQKIDAAERGDFGAVAKWLTKLASKCEGAPE